MINSVVGYQKLRNIERHAGRDQTRATIVIAIEKIHAMGH